MTNVQDDHAGYAVALRVRDRVCVVVGGGPVGERKARELCQGGAAVTVIAPTLTDGLRADANAGRLRHRAGTYRADDLTGAFLVVAATNRPDVNRQVLADAQTHGVLSNRAGDVDGDETGDFDTMATVRRGPLLIAVTAGGASPSVATRVKSTIAQTFGPEWEPWVTLLGEMRRRAKAEIADDATRAELLRRLAARDDLRERLAPPGGLETASVREEIERMLSEARQVGEGQLGLENACPAR